MKALDFLAAIGHDHEAPGYVELRYIAAGKRPTTFFSGSIDEINWDEVKRRNQQGYNVYFGVGRRRRKRGSKPDVSQVGCLWADLDGKDFDRDDPEHGKQRALDHLRAALPPHLQPSFIVDSGYGLHLYWALKEPWTFDDESDVRRLEAVLWGLAAHLRGDRKVAEIARVMRLPGTINHKGETPVRSRMLEHHQDRTFHLEDFIDYEDVIAQPQPPTLPGQPSERKLSRSTLEFLAMGAVDGERNDRLFAAACDMAGCGWTKPNAEERLVEVALRCGLDATEARRTVQSAFSKQRNPARPNIAPPRNHEAADHAGDGLPQIVINGRHMREISDDTRAALVRVNNPPWLFVFGNRLAEILVDDQGRARIRILDVPALRGKADRSANFVKVGARDGILTPARPPEDVVTDILALEKWSEFPSLDRIVGAPIVAPDGSLALESGYLGSARVFYHSKMPLSIGDTTPAPKNVANARRVLLDELLGDFPFADQASRAHTLAVILTSFVRELIRGQTPHHHISSAVEGSGKTLLADICTMVFDPAGASIMTVARSDEEMRKRLTGVLSGGPSHVLLDNLPASVDSADLAAVLTAPIWKDRLLGKSDMLLLPVRCIWISTGNNVEFSGELARRTIFIRLDARMEKPWERQGFHHPMLREWVQENRSALVTACLTLVRCWLDQGQPRATQSLGGFESWSRVMGGILSAIGVDGFLANTAADYRRFAADNAAFGRFVQAWHEKYQFQAVGVSELFPIASSSEVTGEDGHPVIVGQDVLASELGSGSDRARQIRLGNLLRGQVDRVYGSLRIVHAGTAGNAKRYRLESLNGHSG